MSLSLYFAHISYASTQQPTPRQWRRHHFALVVTREIELSRVTFLDPTYEQPHTSQIALF